MNPRVRQVKALDDYRLYLEFTNGERGVYDCTPLLDFGVFRELKDIEYFKRASVLDGTVVWPHEQDICPDTLYLDADRRVWEQDFSSGARSLP
jgi:hypothetical protein